MRTQFFAAALSLLALSPASLADLPSAGFHFSSDVTPPVAFAAYATLSDGNRVFFDGEFCDLYDSDGALLQNLGSTGAGFAFSSFVVIDPTETFAVVGESLNHGLFKVDLTVGGFTPLGTMTFNFDAVFESSNTVIVSAATGGFNSGNDIIRVNTDTAAQTALGHVPGPSGPLTLNAAGDLFYVTQSQLFPAPAHSLLLVKWSAAQVAGGLVDDSNWAVFAARLSGGSSIAVDPVGGNVYVAESVFGRKSDPILAFAADGAKLESVVEAESLNSISNLEFIGADTGSAFRAYRSGAGSRLSYHSTDFGAIDRIIDVEPLGATLVKLGPGATGTGMLRLKVEGAPPFGKVTIWLENQADMLGAERSIDVGLPFVVTSDFSARTLRRAAYRHPSAIAFKRVLTASADGTAGFSFYNTGALDGIAAYEALVMTPAGIPVGTTGTVLQ